MGLLLSLVWHFFNIPDLHRYFSISCIKSFQSGLFVGLFFKASTRSLFAFFGGGNPGGGGGGGGAGGAGGGGGGAGAALGFSSSSSSSNSSSDQSTFDLSIFTRLPSIVMLALPVASSSGLSCTSSSPSSSSHSPSPSS